MLSRAYLLFFSLLSLACFAQDCEKNRFYLDGEILYWEPNQTGMSYCLLTNTLTSSILGSNNQDRQQHVTWDLGFRVGAGLRVANVHCDLSACWTRFHHAMDGSTSTNNEFILGTQLFLGGFLPVGGGGVAQISGGTPGGSATSRWKLHIDLIECDFGYLICFDERFSLHPYLGVEGGWINQKQTIVYTQFFDPNSLVFFDSTITLTNNFQGIGPKFGLDGDFILGCGFGVMGNLSAMLLYGPSHNPAAYHVVGDTVAFPFSDFSVQFQQHRLLPAVQAQIGLNWGKDCFEYFAFYLNAAYEVQYFWNTWRSQSSAIQPIAVPDAGYGNLMLHGFTGQVQLVF